VSELEDRLDMQGLGSPDSGIGLSNFDIENPFIRESDPIISQDEFQEEVDFMFNKPIFNSDNLNLDLDFIMPEVLPIEHEHMPVKSERAFKIEDVSESDMVDCSEEAHVDDTTAALGYPRERSDCNIINNNTTKPVKSKSKAVSAAIKVHSYSANPKSKRLQSMVKKVDLKSSRSKRGCPKKKLYELQKPLDNPEAERCRLNAINAKKNRDRKKQELEAAASEIERLRRENAELKAEAEIAREEREEAFAELEMMKSELKMLGLPVDEREE